METKQFKISMQLVTMIADIKAAKPTRELSLAITKLEEAIHWLDSDEVKNGNMK